MVVPIKSAVVTWFACFEAILLGSSDARAVVLQHTHVEV